MEKRCNYNKGFTMAEALMAISIILVGVISTFVMVFKSFYDISIIKDRLTAVFLAQEGIELIRQRRDSNFLIENNSWNTGLSNGRKYRIGYQVDENGEITGIIFDERFNEPLYQDQNSGIFNYSRRGNQTPFVRQIEIIGISQDPETREFYEIKVIATVQWRAKYLRTPITISAEDHLFNWLNK